MFFPPFAQQVSPAPSDSVTVVADTAGTTFQVADSTLADTSDAITQLNRELGAASDLLIEGEWELFVSRIYDGLAGLVVNMIPRLAGALFVFALFYAVYRLLRSLLHRLMKRSKRIDAGLEHLLMQTFRMVALSFIAVMVLAQLGINVTALMAGLSIVGIAVGFAARDTLENYISGITIMFDKPFRVGDNVEIEEVFGTVEEITLRSTRLRTLDHQIMVMPNTQMINKKLLNHTMLNTLRVAIPFGIAYKEYPQEARQVVLKLAEGDSRLHPAYLPEVAVTALNDSSVDMALWLYLKDPRLEVAVRYEYIEKIREALRRADIEIPFPHVQVFIDEAQALDPSFFAHPQRPPLKPDSDPPQLSS
ncbi:MAG: mechanosensitive ion channel family protein [Rhodothermales bacterium]